MLYLCCSQRITPPVDTAMTSSRAFTFSFLISVAAGLRKYTYVLLFAPPPNARFIYSRAIYAFALLLAANYRSRPHCRVAR